MGKKLLGSWAVMLSVIFFMSCGTAKNNVNSLLSGRWNVLEVKGEKMNAEKFPFIEFDTEAKRLHGNAGCNNFNASYDLDAAKASALKISKGMSTMMACPDMEAEGKILSSFDQIASVKKGASASQLQLLDENGAVVLLLEKAR